VSAESNSVKQIPAVLITLIVMIAILIVGGVFSEPIAAWIRRRFPRFTYEGATFLLIGALEVTAFTMGLLLMYLILWPY